MNAVMHLYRNNDITLYNEQSKEMELLVSEYQKMKMRVGEYEHALESSEAERMYVYHLPSTFPFPHSFQLSSSPDKTEDTSKSSKQKSALPRNELLPLQRVLHRCSRRKHGNSM